MMHVYVCMHIFYTYTFRSSCVILCSSFAVVDCQWRIHYFTFLIVLVCVITSLKRFICCALLLLFGCFLVTCCAIIAAFEWMLQTNLIFAVHCCCAYTFLPDSVQSEIKSPYWFGALAYVCVCVCVCVGKKVERNYTILVSSCVLSCRIWTYSFGFSISCWRSTISELAIQTHAPTSAYYMYVCKCVYKHINGNMCKVVKLNTKVVYFVVYYLRPEILQPTTMYYSSLHQY